MAGTNWKIRQSPTDCGRPGELSYQTNPFVAESGFPTFQSGAFQLHVVPIAHSPEALDYYLKGFFNDQILVNVRATHETWTFSELRRSGDMHRHVSARQSLRPF